MVGQACRDDRSLPPNALILVDHNALSWSLLRGRKLRRCRDGRRGAASSRHTFARDGHGRWRREHDAVAVVGRGEDRPLDVVRRVYRPRVGVTRACAAEGGAAVDPRCRQPQRHPRARRETARAASRRRSSVGEAIQIGDATLLVQAVSVAPRESRPTLREELEARRISSRWNARAARTGSPFAVVQSPNRCSSPERSAAHAARRCCARRDVIKSEGVGGFQLVLLDTDEKSVAVAVTRMADLLREHGISAKFGVARYPHDGVVAEQLIAHAYEQLEREPGDTADRDGRRPRARAARSRPANCPC